MTGRCQHGVDGVAVESAGTHFRLHRTSHRFYFDQMELMAQLGLG